MGINEELSSYLMNTAEALYREYDTENSQQNSDSFQLLRCWNIYTNSSVSCDSHVILCITVAHISIDI